MEQPFDLFWFGRGRNVKVFGMKPQQKVADASPDEIRRVASLLKEIERGQRVLINGSTIDYMFGAMIDFQRHKPTLNQNGRF